VYRIELIEATESLDNNPGQSWFRYVISNKLNTITGYRRGSKTDIHRFANNCVAGLNRKYPPIKMSRKLNAVRVNVNYISLITHGMHRG